MTAGATYPDLAGRVVIVTGAASGIGAATVDALKENSATVVAVDVNEPGLRSKAGDWGSAVAWTALNAALESDVSKLVAESLGRFGRLDGFVANAAITRPGTVVETSFDTWDEVLAVNLRSVFLGAHFAMPAMRASGGGSFVAVASQLGLVGYPDTAAYTAAKGGVVNLIRSMAIDHAPEGIRVNCVCPGPVDTPMLAEGLSKAGESREAAMSRVPLARFGEPGEIAQAILFLLSSSSAYMTGSALVVDGGYTAK